MERTHISNIQVEKRRKPEDEESVLVSRRNVLAGITSAPILAVMGQNAYTYNNEGKKNDDEVVEETDGGEEQIDNSEMIAEELRSPVYEKVLAARTIEAGGLNRYQVLFVNKRGEQITEPFTLTKSVGLSPEEMVWRHEGAGPAGIPGTWINEQKAYISRELGIPVSEIEMLHVYQDLSSTRAEHMNSKVELAYANATTPLESDSKRRDPLTILREETHFTKLPPRVLEEFTPFLIGIACEESRFDANKTNKESGACSILQTMPWVVDKYKVEHSEPNLDARNLEDQLKVSVEHIETTYRELTENLDPALDYIARVYFGGNTASMEKYFLVPLIIGSYNTGQERITNVVQWFLNKYPEPESTAELLGQDEPLFGYDVYFAMMHQCAKEKAVYKFGTESSTYVSKVMGWTLAFSDYEKKQQELQMASNQ